MTPFLLRTSTDIRTLCERLGYGSPRVARFSRRADRSLTQQPQQSQGAQPATALDPSPEPAHERIGSLIAGSIVFATADVRRVG